VIFPTTLNPMADPWLSFSLSIMAVRLPFLV
jgi:hypothetical protein